MVGTPPVGAPVTASTSVTVRIAPEPSVSLVKTVSPVAIAQVGDLLTFRFTATNTGNVTLDGVTVSDPLAGLSPVVCPIGSNVMLPGATIVCTATYRVTQADFESGRITNTATVAANSVLDQSQVTANGTVALQTAATPAISLTKSVSAESVAPGTTVTYTFVVANTGNVRLASISLADPLPGLGAIACPGATGSLDPGQSLTCTALYTVPSSTASGARITNTATVTGVSAAGVTVTSAGVAAVTATGTPLLPFTGTEVRLLSSLAASAIAAGLLLVAVSRRRRPARLPGA